MAIEQIKDLMDKKNITQVLPLDSEKITNMTEEELIEYGYITQVMSTTPTTEPEVEPEDTPDEEPTTEPVVETPTEEPTTEPTTEPEDTPEDTPDIEPDEDDSPVVEEEE